MALHFRHHAQMDITTLFMAVGWKHLDVCVLSKVFFGAEQM
jgi:hypothetical protein